MILQPIDISGEWEGGDGAAAPGIDDSLKTSIENDNYVLYKKHDTIIFRRGNEYYAEINITTRCETKGKRNIDARYSTVATADLSFEVSLGNVVKGGFVSDNSVTVEAHLYDYLMNESVRTIASFKTTTPTGTSVTSTNSTTSFDDCPVELFGYVYSSSSVTVDLDNVNRRALESGELKMQGSISEAGGYKTVKIKDSASGTKMVHISDLNNGAQKKYTVEIIVKEERPWPYDDYVQKYSIYIPFIDELEEDTNDTVNKNDLGLPYLNIVIDSVTHNSVSFHVKTNGKKYKILNSFLSKGLSMGYFYILTNTGGAFDYKGYRVFNVPQTQNNAGYYQIPITSLDDGQTFTFNTHFDFAEGTTYYIGGYRIHDTNPNHRVIENGVEKIPVCFLGSHPDNWRHIDFIPHWPRFYCQHTSGGIAEYDKIFVSDEMRKDTSTGEYYGGYGVNTVPFVYQPKPIEGISMSNDRTYANIEHSITTDGQDTFVVNVDIMPNDWTEYKQEKFTITTSDPNVIGLYPSRSNTAVIRSDIVLSHSKTSVTFYAHNPGVASLSISPVGNPYNRQGDVRLDINNVEVHIPVNKNTTESAKVRVGERVDVAYPRNVTASGRDTTDILLSIVEQSDNIRASITSDYSVSVIGDVAGSATVKCMVGGDYNSVTKSDYEFVINITVEPVPPAQLLPESVPDMLTFDSIEKMKENLLSIMLALNGISHIGQNNWNRLDFLPYAVNVSDGFRIEFSSLMEQLDNLEKNIKFVLEPVAGFLYTQSKNNPSFFNTHKREKDIFDAIHGLYSEYPNKDLNEIAVASFYNNIDQFDYRHDFVQSRFDWCNAMIDALGIGGE